MQEQERRGADDREEQPRFPPAQADVSLGARPGTFCPIGMEEKEYETDAVSETRDGQPGIGTRQEVRGGAGDGSVSDAGNE